MKHDEIIHYSQFNIFYSGTPLYVIYVYHVFVCIFERECVAMHIHLHVCASDCCTETAKLMHHSQE